MTVEDEIRDRIVRQIGKALIEIGWRRLRPAADALEQVVSHLKDLADREDAK